MDYTPPTATRPVFNTKDFVKKMPKNYPHLTFSKIG